MTPFFDPTQLMQDLVPILLGPLGCPMYEAPECCMNNRGGILPIRCLGQRVPVHTSLGGG